MDTIKIDFDVFKALTAKRRSEDMTYNDVLRELLGLGKTTNHSPSASKPPVRNIGDFISKGVTFPAGTEFSVIYKGKRYFAKAEDGCMLLEDGYRATSPSDAAFHITKTNVNGWRFWDCRLPDTEVWHSLDVARFRKD